MNKGDGKRKYIYGVPAVAVYLRQAERTVQRKIRAGKIRALRGAGGAVAVRWEDAEAAAKEAQRERRGRKGGQKR